MTSLLRRIDEAVLMTERGEYLQALTEFLDIYGTDDSPPLNSAKTASGLSYFGLCLALVQKKYKAGADLCKRALELEFYNGDHYANLARVYVLIGNRKRALETAEAGLKIAPENEPLKRVRRELGVRARPPVPFLDRSNPINVSLGQARHAKKQAERQKSAKKR
ncbi:MAG TPA: tetratricopeptide repeat protein [Thermoanaerobaculia bacterium]|nr:tetratricopeptide repeat protein [Thermoanaerobaculia bacterium]